VRIASARLLSVEFWSARELKFAGLDWTLAEMGGTGRGRLVAAIEIECDSGTYIRSIARDLGKVLGVEACVAGLTRTRVGPFCLLQACSLGEAVRSIENGFVGRIAHAADIAALGSTGLVLGSGRALRFVQGSTVDANGSAGTNRIYDCGGRFIGMGEINEDRLLRPKVVLQTSEDRPA
jgi:tRNA pseudouridine55 synthase